MSGPEETPPDIFKRIKERLIKPDEETVFENQARESLMLVANAPGKPEPLVRYGRDVEFTNFAPGTVVRIVDTNANGEENKYWLALGKITKDEITLYQPKNPDMDTEKEPDTGNDRLNLKKGWRLEKITLKGSYHEIEGLSEKIIGSHYIKLIEKLLKEKGLPVPDWNAGSEPEPATVFKTTRLELMHAGTKEKKIEDRRLRNLVPVKAESEAGY